MSLNTYLENLKANQGKILKAVRDTSEELETLRLEKKDLVKEIGSSDVLLRASIEGVKSAKGTLSKLQESVAQQLVARREREEELDIVEADFLSREKDLMERNGQLELQILKLDKDIASKNRANKELAEKGNKLHNIWKNLTREVFIMRDEHKKISAEVSDSRSAAGDIIANANDVLSEAKVREANTKVILQKAQDKLGRIEKVAKDSEDHPLAFLK